MSTMVRSNEVYDIALNRPDVIPQEVSSQIHRMGGAIAEARRDIEQTLQVERRITAARANTAPEAKQPPRPQPPKRVRAAAPPQASSEGPAWTPATPEVEKWASPVPDSLRSSHYQRRARLLLQALDTERAAAVGYPGGDGGGGGYGAAPGLNGGGMNGGGMVGGGMDGGGMEGEGGSYFVSPELQVCRRCPAPCLPRAHARARAHAPTHASRPLLTHPLAHARARPVSSLTLPATLRACCGTRSLTR